MCLILFKPRGSSFDANLLRAAQKTNPHGVGFMMPSGADTVYSSKGLWEPERVREFWDKHQHKSLAVHFRSRTQGEINQENCHPFQVLSKHRHGRDLWMMHNGTINAAQRREPRKSDSYNFVQYALKPVLEGNPGRIDELDFQRFLEQKIGGWNKLLFMDGKGKVIIINQRAGHERDGCWVSNLYSIRQVHRHTDLWNAHLANRFHDYFDDDDDADDPTLEENRHREMLRSRMRNLQLHGTNQLSFDMNSVQELITRHNTLKNRPTELQQLITTSESGHIEPCLVPVNWSTPGGQSKMKWVTTRDSKGWPDSGHYVQDDDQTQ